MPFTRVAGSQGAYRPYRIVIGLIDDDGQYHWPIEAIQEHGAWMAEKMVDDLPYLSGVFDEETTSRAGRDDDGNPVMLSSPSLVFAGQVTPLRMAQATDADVTALLDELTGRLLSVLNQDRATVVYVDQVWQLERTA